MRDPKVGGSNPPPAIFLHIGCQERDEEKGVNHRIYVLYSSIYSINQQQNESTGLSHNL